MGKHPDDLPLDPAPQGAARGEDRDDLRRQPWYQFTQEIQALLDSGNYEWAEDTLSGIQTSVELRKTVTDGQRTAVRNIEHARQRSDGWRRRRYEGR